MQGPGPGARTWICPRLLLGEPGSTVGRLTQLMAPPGTSATDTSTAPTAPKAPAGSRAPAFTSRALANREPAPRAPPPLGQSPRSRDFALAPPPGGWDRGCARAPGSSHLGSGGGRGLRDGAWPDLAPPRPPTISTRGSFERLVVDSEMDGPRGCCKDEAPWKKLSKEVGGLRREAGAEDCSLAIRWNF